MRRGCLLARAVSSADALVYAYKLTGPDAVAVRAIAIPLAGRDSPFETGDWPTGPGSF